MGIERTDFCSDFRILPDASKMFLLTARGWIVWTLEHLLAFDGF